MQKAQFSVLLQYLLNRTVLPHFVKRLIYSMSSPLLHFHFLHCLSSPFKPTFPTEIMWSTQLCKLYCQGWERLYMVSTADVPGPPVPWQSHANSPDFHSISTACCSTQGSHARHLNTCLQHYSEFHLSPYNFEPKIITVMWLYKLYTRYCAIKIPICFSST